MSHDISEHISFLFFLVSFLIDIGYQEEICQGDIKCSYKTIFMLNVGTFVIYTGLSELVVKKKTHIFFLLMQKIQTLVLSHSSNYIPWINWDLIWNHIIIPTSRVRLKSAVWPLCSYRASNHPESQGLHKMEVLSNVQIVQTTETHS